MKFKREYFCCSPKLLRNIDEIHEVEAAITDVAWKDHFSIDAEGHTYEHQSGYNRALAAQLLKRGWTMQPKLCTKPSLIGDASKRDIFVEVQFGNSATLYRDYYTGVKRANTRTPFRCHLLLYFHRCPREHLSIMPTHRCTVQKSPFG